MIAAIQWAVDNGIKIVNLGLGGTGTTTLESACQAAYERGLLLVAAAGNSGPGADTVSAPARYPSVIAVAATDRSDLCASFSSTGPSVELAAPGVSVYSTLLGGGYGTKSGTSMASPHVAGAGALAWAAYPTWTNLDVRSCLTTTADDLGPAGRDGQYGHGLVDADEAAGVATPPPVVPGKMYVAAIAVTLSVKGTNAQATATVTVMDTSGKPVTGATVTGRWSGAATGTVSGTTDATGKATLKSNTVKKPPTGTLFTLCVGDVVKAGWVYDQALNRETCDSVPAG